MWDRNERFLAAIDMSRVLKTKMEMRSENSDPKTLGLQKLVCQRHLLLETAAFCGGVCAFPVDFNHAITTFTMNDNVCTCVRLSRKSSNGVSDNSSVSTTGPSR